MGEGDFNDPELQSTLKRIYEQGGDQSQVAKALAEHASNKQRQL